MFLTAFLRTGAKDDYLFHFLVPHREYRASAKAESVEIPGFYIPVFQVQNPGMEKQFTSGQLEIIRDGRLIIPGFVRYILYKNRKEDSIKGNAWTACSLSADQRRLVRLTCGEVWFLLQRVEKEFFCHLARAAVCLCR